MKVCYIWHIILHILYIISRHYYSHIARSDTELNLDQVNDIYRPHAPCTQIAMHAWASPFRTITLDRCRYSPVPVYRSVFGFWHVYMLTLTSSSVGSNMVMNIKNSEV